MGNTSWSKKRPIATVRDIGDDEILTQYGQEREDGRGFRGQPRFDRDERDVSMIAGKLSVIEAIRLISSRSTLAPQDAVRHFSVGALREADYVVVHTPTKRNPDHVSVIAPEGSNAQDWWSRQGEPMLELLVLDGTHTEEGDDNDE